MSVNGPVVSGDLFAFYGLLKQGADGTPEHIDLETAGAFLGPCRLIGALYDLGGFPGLVRGDILCHAMLYRLNDTDIVAALDAFEDVLPETPERSEYLRIKSAVLDDTGKPTGDQAWIYWYNQSVTGKRLLEDGNWPLQGGRRDRMAEEV
ncbi:MAG: gamma-glutamylcyclotransferase family protein [Pseudomonadota bacterium]